VSTLSKLALAVVGAVLTGGMVFGLVQVGTAEEPDETIPAVEDTTTTSTSSATSSSTTTTPTSTTTATHLEPSSSCQEHPGETPICPPGQATTTVPAEDTLVIQGTGDVNLDPFHIPNLAANGYDYAWAGLDGLFLADDLTVINLECAPSDLGTAEPKEFVFRCPPESLSALADAGVEVANMGNNHSGDYGKEALVDGRANLIGSGVSPVGAGEYVSQAGEPAIFESKGWRVAVVGFGGVVPTPAWLATEDRAGMRDGDDIPSMVEAVAAAADQADIVVVSIHWGVELDTKPRPDDIERAVAMIEAGADVIFGHHSHRLQSMEMVNDSAVFWGLGNFVWPRFSTAGSTTGVARAVIHPDGTIEACLIPAFIENSGQPVLTGEPECRPER
jgi:poly-gamma-glutamate capsule biosynthesis protein CapA/YwtB (metallophosphatase superfamily)